MPRCGSCGGFGVTLPLRAGICGHCERTSVAAPPALGAASVGQKRGRADAALSAEEIARILEAGADDAVPALDSSGVKRMLLTLERAVSKNMALRAKHASEPIKFLDSEVELDRALKALHALAAAPEQYSVLCASETLRSTFPSLLAHDNVDISVDVIELLKELLDDDVVGASETARAAALSLLEAFDSADILNLAMDNLSRLGAARPASEGDAQQDSNCVLACFELVEAVVALAPSPYASRLCRTTASGASSPLLNSLLAHAASKTFDDAKSLASEVLATLVSADPDIVARIGAGSFRGGSVDGIECLLESVAVYKRRAPLGADEAETVNNLFDVLCTCLVR
jgi:beta-catenin-like protein 1